MGEHAFPVCSLSFLTWVEIIGRRVRKIFACLPIVLYSLNIITGRIILKNKMLLFIIKFDKIIVSCYMIYGKYVKI